MLFGPIILIVLFNFTPLIQCRVVFLPFFDGPLASDAISFEFVFLTSTSTIATSCYTTLDHVTQCRRHRGVEEKPSKIFKKSTFSPSRIEMVETTSLNLSELNIISRSVTDLSSSIESELNQKLLTNVFQYRQLITPSTLKSKGIDGYWNYITIKDAEDCIGTTISLSQLYSCLGYTVQNTATYTVTLTLTETQTVGYEPFMTISGCTPPFFPFASCPSSDDSLTDNFGSIASFLNIENVNPSESSTEPSAESNSSTMNQVMMISLTDGAYLSPDDAYLIPDDGGLSNMAMSSIQVFHPNKQNNTVTASMLDNIVTGSNFSGEETSASYSAAQQCMAKQSNSAFKTFRFFHRFFQLFHCLFNHLTEKFKGLI